jgi:hypothetical protein
LILLGIGAWLLGVVYLLALFDPTIGLRAALKSRQRVVVIGSIFSIGAYVAILTLTFALLLTSHGLGTWRRLIVRTTQS